MRRAVLALILEAERPQTAYQLFSQLRESHKGAVPPTIYRALDFLIAQGFVLKVEGLNAFLPNMHFEGRNRPVQFLICRMCGHVATIENGEISEALGRAAEREGFRPDRATVELDGVCADCSPGSSA